MKSKTVSVHNQTSWANSVFTFHEDDPVVCRDCTLDLTNLTVTPGHCWLSISCLHDFSKARPKHYWRTHLWTHGWTVLHCTDLYTPPSTPPVHLLPGLSEYCKAAIERREKVGLQPWQGPSPANPHIILLRKPSEGPSPSQEARVKCEGICIANHHFLLRGLTRQ